MSKKHATTALKLHGKVLAFNISPKGEIEGALVETADGPVQLNFPKRDAEVMARSMKIGAVVEVPATVESEKGEHPVYKAHEKDAHTSGTVTRLNYALHGEVNGCHLDDGTFLHLRPEGARKYKLRVGERVKATGSRRAGHDALVVEASEVMRLS